MLGALLSEFGEAPKLQDVELDEPRTGEVLVRIAASGICGTDIHAIHGRSNVARNLPIVLGHEASGVIEAVGPGVADIIVGDHVVIALSGPCGLCWQCGRGKLEFCEGENTRSVFGEMPDGSTRLKHDDRDAYPFLGVGSLAQFAVVRREAVVKVDRDLSLVSLALAGCSVSTGLGAVFNVAKVAADESVIVVGCGGVGLNVIQAARIAGASHILAVDTNPARLDMASNFGATHCLASAGGEEELESFVRNHVPRGVDYAFDVVGSATIISQLMPLTAPGGTTVAVGSVDWSSDISVPAGALLGGQRKLTSVMGGGRPVREISRIVTLYRSGRLKLDELIGASFPLPEIGDALALAERGEIAKISVRIDERML